MTQGAQQSSSQAAVRGRKDRIGLANAAFKTAFVLSSVEQRTVLEKAFGTARFAYNWALAEWEKRRQAGESNSFEKLRNALNAIKHEQFPWMAEVPKDVTAEAIRDLATAFKNFFDSTKGKSKARARYPRRKKKGKAKFAFRLPADRLRFRPALNAQGQATTEVYLSTIGWVMLAEEFIPFGKIVYATISRRADRFFVSFCMEYLPVTRVRKITRQRSTGIDLGLKHTMTLANGERVDGPRMLAEEQKKLRRANRRLHRRDKGSKSRAKAILRVSRIHRRIADIRLDFTEKTTTTLLRRYDIIGIEDLQVAGMLKSKRFSRSLADASFGMLAAALMRKAPKYGCLVIQVDRFFASSKTCRKCQTKNQDLTLADRVFRCVSSTCGHEEDRDVQAARNIQHEALRTLPAASGEFTPVEIRSLPLRPQGPGGKADRRSRKRQPLGAATSNAGGRHKSDNPVIQL